MRETLIDLLKQTSSLFEILKITGTDASTKVEAIDSTKSVFLKVSLKNPISQFEGEFGIASLPMLSGLLTFPSYNTDDAKLIVSEEEQGGQKFVSEFRFEDAKGGFSVFRLTPPKLVPEQAEILRIPWEVEFEPNKSRLLEFTQLASLYGKIDDHFSPAMVNGNLHFRIGDENSSTNNASMIFEPDISAKLRGDVRYPTSLFLSTVKLCGIHPMKISFAATCIQITCETEYANYSYIIRGSR